MGATDYLKTSREEGYKPPPKAKPDEGDNDPDEANSTSRIIKLSDEEQKAFQGAKLGEELACEVHGNIEEDGHFHVMTVAPMGGAKTYGEDQMAGQVARGIDPMMAMK